MTPSLLFLLLMSTAAAWIALYKIHKRVSALEHDNQILEEWLKHLIATIEPEEPPE